MFYALLYNKYDFKAESQIAVVVFASSTSIEITKASGIHSCTDLIKDRVRIYAANGRCSVHYNLNYVSVSVFQL